MTVDASMVRAVIVGIEKYAAGEQWNLDGPASDALRIATWLRGLGVPPQNIVALVSPLDRNAQSVAADLLALGLESRPASFDDVRDVFFEQLPKATTTGEFLLVYWSGHGVTDTSLQQRLFLENAGAKNKVNINTMDLVVSFTNADFGDRLREQLVIVDACANYVQDMRLDLPLPSFSSAPSRNRQVEANLLMAASQGEKAALAQSAQSGVFTSVVVNWLKLHAHVLPPDVDSLMDAVRAHFEQLRSNNATRQRPTRITITTPKLGTQYLLMGGTPASDEEREAAFASGLTTGQLRRLAVAICACPQMSSTAARDQFVKALHLVLGEAVRADDPVDDIVSLLAKAVVGHNFQSVFDQLLAMEATDETAKLAAAGVRHLWNLQIAVVPLLDALQRVPIDRIARAIVLTSCDAGGLVSDSEIELALERLADLSVQGTENSLLGEFALRLEHLTHVGSLVLSEGWCARHGVDDDRRNTLRPRFESEASATRKLVVDLRESHLGVWQSGVSGYLSPNWCPRRVGCAPTLSGVQGAVNELVNWATASADELTVGFLVGFEPPAEAPERWMYQGPTIAPIPLCDEFPVVLHLDRTEIEQLTNAWREKLRAIPVALTNELHVHWLDDDNPAAIRKAVRSAPAGLVALRFVPQARKDKRDDAILAAVAAGAPFVLWADSAPAPGYQLADQIAQLIENTTEPSFPEALWSERANDPFLSTAVRVIWDRPDEIPPRLERLGQRLVQHG